MKLALVLFDGVTFLDFVGFYDVIHRLKQFEPTRGVTWDICGIREEVTDELGMTVRIPVCRPDLSTYDLLFVPGGMGTRALRTNEAFIGWLRGAETVPYKVSVCTGSLLLGAAGFLQGKHATTHPRAYDLLAPYCAAVVQERLVRDGFTFTGGGVSTSIDMGLAIVSLLAGEEARLEVKRQLDYPYEAPAMIDCRINEKAREPL